MEYPMGHPVGYSWPLINYSLNLRKGIVTATAMTDVLITITAAWAVDREFVSIVEPVGGSVRVRLGSGSAWFGFCSGRFGSGWVDGSGSAWFGLGLVRVLFGSGRFGVGSFRVRFGLVQIRFGLGSGRVGFCSSRLQLGSVRVWFGLWCRDRWLGPPLPRAPGARMKVFTQTSSTNIDVYIFMKNNNICIYIYIERERERAAAC